MPRSPDPPAPTPHPADVRFGARSVLALTALALVAVPFGLLLFLVEDRWRPLLRLDAGARDGLHGVATGSPGFVAVMRLLSTLGSTAVWATVFAVVVAWLLWRRLAHTAVFVVVTVVGSAALNGLVKVAVNRSRPVLVDPVAHANGMSFPSGHAQAAVVGWAVLLLVLLPMLATAWRRVLVVLAAVLVLGIGFSRIALGVHFVSDVVGGYVLGAAWVAAMTATFTAWRAERGPSGRRDQAQPSRKAASRLVAPAALRSGDAPTSRDTAADKE